MDDSVADGMMTRLVFHNLLPQQDKDEALRSKEQGNFSDDDFK